MFKQTNKINVQTKYNIKEILFYLFTAITNTMSYFLQGTISNNQESVRVFRGIQLIRDPNFVLKILIIELSLKKV